jgi:hypothetical protein
VTKSWQHPPFGNKPLTSLLLTLLLTVPSGCVYTSSGITDYVTLEAALPAINAASPVPALSAGQGNYFDSQAFDPCIIPDPEDSTKLLLMFSAMPAPVANDFYEVARATANIAEPRTWTVSSSPVFHVGSPGAWDGVHVRCDSLVYTDGTLYMFYDGAYDMGRVQIGLARSTDGGLTWTRDPGNPVIPASGDEYWASSAAVIEDNGTWHAWYNHSTSCCSIGGQYLNGVRYASAVNPAGPWIKTNVTLLSEAPKFIEWHQVFKLGSDYVIVYETGSEDTDWTIGLAKATTAGSAFAKSAKNPILAGSGIPGRFDRYHVATAAMFQASGIWYLMYCGASDHEFPVTSNHWSLAVTEIGAGGGSQKQ